ncbi:MAG: 16S rRNA pseudouridine(516) synthase [Clostridia bacterium]|nr:16S rRNA pseudouridine(516) synthase [Clostridia bacterium]
MRLDRWLSTLGEGSRSQLQKLIRAGKAQVNGRTVTDPGFSCNTLADSLSLNGKSTDGRLERHVMLHKPAGLLTAARDKKQPTVMDLLPPAYASIGCMPVGRLDKDTTGLLLLTTDGEMNHRLLAPGRHVDKVYRAVVDGPLTDADVSAFAAGLKLSDFDAQPARLEILASSPEEATALVTVQEGKFHQVKRMFSAVGREVTALHRLSFGPLQLDDQLPEGRWRELTDDELHSLYRAARMEE